MDASGVYPPDAKRIKDRLTESPPEQVVWRPVSLAHPYHGIDMREEEIYFALIKGVHALSLVQYISDELVVPLAGGLVVRLATTFMMFVLPPVAEII